jgi:hypothetical protein
VRYTCFMTFIAWWACISWEAFITHVLQDLIRQTLYGSHYNITFDDSTIRYCLSGLRQSVMCSADTSVIVWQWSDAYNRAMERTDIPHSCKDFTKIQEWVRNRYVDVNGLDLTSYHWFVVDHEIHVIRLYGTSNPFFNGTLASISSQITFTVIRSSRGTNSTDCTMLITTHQHAKLIQNLDV